MLSKYNVLKILMSIVLLIFGCISQSYAEEQSKLQNIGGKHDYYPSKKLNEFESRYKELELKFGNLRQQYQELKVENKELVQSINMIKIELSENTDKNIKLSSVNSKLEQELGSGRQYSTWTGILLACVAVIVTVLGVGIALMAFVGLRDIKKAAIDATLTQSESLVGKAIQDGAFNELIHSAVERAIYRDILSDTDFPENDVREDNEDK